MKDESLKYSAGPIADYFRREGIFDFASAVDYVHKLPYGRNAYKRMSTIVLIEQKGTCSTKHALLKRLADEIEMECDLVLCIFKMNASNMPLVASILEDYGLEYIPEAHNYIHYHGMDVDVTFPAKHFNLKEEDVLSKRNIEADQSTNFKVAYHQSFIQNWIDAEGISLDFSTVWEAREKCIAKLAESAGASA